MRGKENLKVLVVDDDSYAKYITQHHLKRLGLRNIIEASDGEMALNLLETEKVDLIISDWRMPNMSGIEFFKAVRNRPGLKEIPFLMITVEADNAKIHEARELGIDDCLTKPIIADTFEKKINTLLKLG